MTHALPYPNLDLVLTEAVATIAALRAGSRRVLLRCEPGAGGSCCAASICFPGPRSLPPRMARGPPAVPRVTLWPTSYLICLGPIPTAACGRRWSGSDERRISRVQLIFVPVPIAHTARSFGQLSRGLVIEM